MEFGLKVTFSSKISSLSRLVAATSASQQSTPPYRRRCGIKCGTVASIRDIWALDSVQVDVLAENAGSPCSLPVYDNVGPPNSFAQ